jgi:hypothetical protein
MREDECGQGDRDDDQNALSPPGGLAPLRRASRGVASGERCPPGGAGEVLVLFLWNRSRRIGNRQCGVATRSRLNLRGVEFAAELLVSEGEEIV